MDKKREMAHYAYQNVALYRRKWQNECWIGETKGQGVWQDLPCLEKKDLVSAGAEAISGEYMGKYATEGLLRTHTSGTSGIYMNTYWENRDYLASLLPLWMERWKAAKIHPKDKVCFFNTVLPHDMDKLEEENKLIFSKSNMTERRLEEIYGTMQEFSPDWLLLHPSMAMLLCDLVERSGRSALPSLRYIEITGEMCLPSQKERMKRVFSCEVKSHYGSMEVSTIGYEEEEGSYRLLESSTYLEILDDNGKAMEDHVEGNIYVTSLHNHAMPIIRYGLGDRGKIIRKHCGKKEVRYLQLCKARKYDRLSLPDGTIMAPDGLLGPVERISSAEETAILQFRAVQETKDCIRLHVILDSDYEKEVFIEQYMSLLENRFKDGIRYEFTFQEERMLPDRLTGKLGWFESKCKD